MDSEDEKWTRIEHDLCDEDDKARKEKTKDLDHSTCEDIPKNCVLTLSGLIPILANPTLVDNKTFAAFFVLVDVCHSIFKRLISTSTFPLRILPFYDSS